MTAVRRFRTSLGIALWLLLGSHSLATEGIPTQPSRHLLDLTGKGANALKLPSDVAISKGNIFVVDGGNHRVVGFRADGSQLLSFGRKGSGAGEFLDPVGIGADSDGRLYVADRSNHRIQVFESDGSFIRQFPVSHQGVPVRPIDVAVSPSGGRIYVTGNNSHNLLLFKRDGSPAGTWGQEGIESGEFRYPATLLTLRDGRVAVIDVLNTRLQVFNKSGEYRASVGEWGVLPGQLFRPKGVAVDDRGLLYISDSYMNVVQVFEDTGRFLYVLQTTHGSHELRTPVGMTIDGNNRLYVAEMRNDRVSVYQLGQ